MLLLTFFFRKPFNCYVAILQYSKFVIVKRIIPTHCRMHGIQAKPNCPLEVFKGDLSKRS